MKFVNIPYHTWISLCFSGVGLTSTGFGVMATGLVSLLSLSLSPELRRRVSNLEQLARAGPAPGAWSRRSVMIQTHDNAGDLTTDHIRFSRGRARGHQRPQRQGPTQCVYRLGATCVYSVPVRRL